MKTFSPGFWIISIALILSFSMPCYAQVETQSLFTPEGIRWQLKEPCRFSMGNRSFLITQIGFHSDTMWLGKNYFIRFFVLDAAYKRYNPGLNSMITQFYGDESFNSYNMIEASGYVFPFLKFGKLTFVHTYACPPGGSTFSNPQITTQMFPPPMCIEACETTITKIDGIFSPLP